MLAVVMTAAARGDDARGLEPSAARDRRRTPVVDVFETCKAAVVNISSTRRFTIRPGLGGFGGSLNDLFNLPPQTVTQQSVGSGFLIHPDGYIVTNAHVVASTMQRKIIFSDKRELPAEIIASDPANDLAILKVDSSGDLPYLPLGRSDDLMIGETVVAIGNPLGLQHTCTAGIISALNRELRFQNNITYTGLIQTDASINPGNSGGPLLNVNSELIGVNSAIRGDAQNIGFAIPVDKLRKLLPNYLDIERVRRVALGLHLEADFAKSTSAAGSDLRVARVDAGSPAAEAGVRVGDIVRAINGKPTPNYLDAFSVLEKAPIGKPIAFTLQRGGKTMKLSVTMIAMKQYSAKLMAERFGIEVREMTQAEIRRLGLNGPIGLVVTGVAKGSEAASKGLSPGDYVLRIGQIYVRSMDELGSTLELIPSMRQVAIGVMRIHDTGEAEQGDMFLTAK
jgi:serine protease Do